MAALNIYAPLSPAFAKENKKAWKTRVPEKKSLNKNTGVQTILETLYSNAKWSKDPSVAFSKVLPADTPMLITRTNTYRGQHFSVVDGAPEMRDGCLWIGVRLPLEKNEAAARTACYAAAELLVSKMRTQLEKVRARRVNGSILMKKPTASEVHLYCVIAFE